MPAGPMKMQPIDRSATMPVPLLPLSPSSSDSEVAQAPRAKVRPTRTDEVRAAKARITRRNSLLKQRQAQRREPV